MSRPSASGGATLPEARNAPGCVAIGRLTHPAGVVMGVTLLAVATLVLFIALPRL